MISTTGSQRAGSVVATWIYNVVSGALTASGIVYTDTSTVDLNGDTSSINLNPLFTNYSGNINSGYISLFANIVDATTWTIKIGARVI